MPVIADKFLEIQDLSKGMNTYDPISRVPAGYYVDAQNMLLTSKAPITIGGLTKFNTTAAPNAETIVWCEPYTSGSPAVTTLLVATDAGVLYKYNATTDVWQTLRTGLSTTAFTWTHVPFRGSLLFSNGTDAIMKYNGTNVLPVGSVLAADMEADETWTGTNQSFVSTILDQRREGLQSLKIVSVGNALKTYGAAQDFQVGINGAPNFGGTDLFKMQVFKAAGTSNGTVRIRFADFTTQATKYFEKSVTVSTDGWSTISFAISTFTNTGTAVWTNIGFFQIFIDAGDFLVFDDAYFIYTLAPPVGGLIDLYNQQLMVSGIAADLVAMQYSDAGTPDYFPAANIARFSGGRHALEKTDQVTALRSYFDELIVGKVNSAWTFSGAGTNVSISALPMTIGIDSHRGVTETPWALHYLFENNIFGSRLTSRGLVSTNISSLLQTIDGTLLADVDAIRSDRTHTIRWSFPVTTVTGENGLGLLYDYVADAWTSRYTPHIRYMTRAIIDGNHEILAVQYDGFVRRMDVGTSFDGTAIESYVTLPYMQSGDATKHGDVVRWMNGTVYLKGTASVRIEARFADEPHEFESAAFELMETVQATPNGDKGYFDIARTSRWIQLRIRATSGSFELIMPLVIGYADTQRRI